MFSTPSKILDPPKSWRKTTSGRYPPFLKSGPTCSSGPFQPHPTCRIDRQKEFSIDFLSDAFQNVSGEVHAANLLKDSNLHLLPCVALDEFFHLLPGERGSVLPKSGSSQDHPADRGTPLESHGDEPYSSPRPEGRDRDIHRA